MHFVFTLWVKEVIIKITLMCFFNMSLYFIHPLSEICVLLKMLSTSRVSFKCFGR